MKIIIYIVFLLIAFSFALDPQDKMEGVLELNEKDFFDVVGKGKPVLVEFYAPWCGYCKAFATKYAKLGKLISSSPRKDDVIIAKVNGDVQEELSNKLDVQGFPTIYYFAANSKDPIEYQGDLNVKGILDFLQEKIDS